ncbi:hypothetical protein HQQ81_01155 [Microbacteriaceae bacterium VKM Ac-2854]|nr:hypothetical protein [Microbacteriaceae bacterium VKM Ac-2854]
MTTVIIPWRAQPSRLAAYDAVTAWYREVLPEARILPIDSGDTPFNLARCRNLGVASVEPDEPIVIADADTFPEEAPLRAAIAAAGDGVTHLPYTEYRWLGPEGTAQYFAGTALPDCEYTVVHGACSGVYVSTPRVWAAHAGQDEGFRGWGFEDSAWLVAHRMLLGAEPARHEGRVYALHHLTQLREGEQYEANAARMQRYRDAAAQGKSAFVTFLEELGD